MPQFEGAEASWYHLGASHSSLVLFIVPRQMVSLGDPTRRSCDACESFGAMVKKLIKHSTCRRRLGTVRTHEPHTLNRSSNHRPNHLAFSATASTQLVSPSSPLALSTLLFPHSLPGIRPQQESRRWYDGASVEAVVRRRLHSTSVHSRMRSRVPPSWGG